MREPVHRHRSAEKLVSVRQRGEISAAAEMTASNLVVSPSHVGRKTLQVLPNSSKPLLSTLQLAKVAVRRIARKLNLKKLLTALQIATAY